ncbi:hypothetical protein BJ165DRAFT_1510135 [Panaeolus papilionaceus]|nr:hypothetical protein BJ165DRAFT_1510135 [Panaeolus papilionaceus]
METTSSYFHIFPRDTGDTSCNRSTWSIAWTCLLTFFTCNWVAIHPNAASEI